MPLSATFTKGMASLMDVAKLDPPVAKAMPNAQGYASTADEIEKIETELAEAKKEVTKAAEAYNKLVDKLEKVEDVLDKHGATFGKALKQYVKQGRDYPQKAYQVGCEGIEAGMGEIDKAVLAAKNKYPEIKLK